MSLRQPAGDPAEPTPAFRRRFRMFGWAATLLFTALSLAYLVVTPTLYAADEFFHYDRVLAAEHGQVFVTPGDFHVSVGAARVKAIVSADEVILGRTTLATSEAPDRSTRDSFDELGGNSRPATGPLNYMAQHPPLYYTLMGSALRVIPGSDSMPGDVEILVLRLLNLLLLIPLPWLSLLTARCLLGSGPVVFACAFLPLLVPGVLRGAVTINNDNLSILIGAVAALCVAKIIRGHDGWKLAAVCAVTCVAASLTKGTVLVLMAAIPGAYVLQAVRTRRLPGAAVIATLSAGALASTAWWIANKIRYGKFSPDAIDPSAFSRYRLPGEPVDMGAFIYKATVVMPARFWGSLGVLEPPAPPYVLTTVLTLAVAAAFVVALRVKRVRIIVLIFAAQLVVFGLSVLYTSWSAYQVTVGISGLQGRYFYPALFSVVFPSIVAVGNLLRRRPRLVVPVVLLVGLILDAWFLLIMFRYLYLIDGSESITTRLETAVRQMLDYAPLPPAGTICLISMGALMGIAGLGMTAKACIRRPKVAAVPE
ncbi:DUF2142 domain-containing protein [Nakamurella sp. YIM 132087]|uniref:DUF2142 domain-containing protein n=1 Tax=Nakamurella alba TaxID=2665158 RepID=A0A7K1FPF0_9ACTN|nr:DUF2142 domain-containing protein [Nakamurella alba]MTD16022.1 DUF2142 domain-containing protein [Nakamurella alba]